MAMQQHVAPMSAPQVMMPASSPAAPSSLHSSHYMQYYSPYPGETVLQRLGKHMVLRLGQVFFHELSNFLALWKWPPLTK